MDDFDRIHRIGEDADKFKISEKMDQPLQRKPKKKKGEKSFKETLINKEKEVIKEEKKEIKPEPPPPRAKYKNGKRVL